MNLRRMCQDSNQQVLVFLNRPLQETAYAYAYAYADVDLEATNLRRRLGKGPAGLLTGRGGGHGRSCRRAPGVAGIKVGESESEASLASSWW